MGTLLRSEEMQLVQLFVQIEAAHDTVDELGKLGLIQFRDLNPDVSAFQRNFVNEVRRCNEMERKIRFFEHQISVEVKDMMAEKKVDSSILQNGLWEEETKSMPLDELENKLTDLEKELKEMNENQEKLNRNHNELIEMKYVLTEDSTFFTESVSNRLITQDGQED